MRHKATAIVLTLACGLALALAAQGPSESQGKQLNLTGCLQTGTEPNSFILKNASVQTAAGSEATPAELAKADTEYKLIADANVKLKDHVGQKVQVTGTITGQTGEAAQMSQFKVKSVKKVSESCP